MTDIQPSKEPESAARTCTERDRTINYNGDEMRSTTFQCGTCHARWIAELVPAAKFCPACGVKFTKTADVSV